MEKQALPESKGHGVDARRRLRGFRAYSDCAETARAAPYRLATAAAKAVARSEPRPVARSKPG
jgi:hypothetical protein